MRCSFKSEGLKNQDDTVGPLHLITTCESWKHPASLISACVKLKFDANVAGKSYNSVIRVKKSVSCQNSFGLDPHPGSRNNIYLRTKKIQLNKTPVFQSPGAQWNVDLENSTAGMSEAYDQNRETD